MSIKESSAGQIRVAFPGRCRATFACCPAFCWPGVPATRWPVKVIFGWLTGLAYSILFGTGLHAGHENLTPFGWVFMLLILPFLFWNRISAPVTVPHPTHPNMAKFSTREEWDYFNGQICDQIRGVGQMKLSHLIAGLYQNISKHTMHHADPEITVQNLPESQSNVEKEFAEDGTMPKGSALNFLKV